MVRNDRRTHSTMALDSRTYDKPSGYPGRLPAKEALRILTAETDAQRWALAEQSPFVTAACTLDHPTGVGGERMAARARRTGMGRHRVQRVNAERPRGRRLAQAFS